MHDGDKRRILGIALAAALLLGACATSATGTPPTAGPASVTPVPTTAPSLAASSAPATAAASPTAAPRPTAAPNPVATNKVAIVNFAFNPDAVVVKVGTTVTWTNQGRTHTVTADDGSFDSGDIAGGATFTVTFKTAGVFAYHCKIHTAMVAQVAVSP